MNKSLSLTIKILDQHTAKARNQEGEPQVYSGLCQTSIRSFI